MPSEGPLAPRNRPIAVRATRPDLIDIPDAQPVQQPLPQSAQPYVVFINPPTTAAPPPAPVARPHSQITHHHYAHRSVSRQGHSVLGIASLALGVIACVICWMPVLGLAAVPIGFIGLILGTLGFLLSAMFRKSSVALSAGAVFICLMAIGISIASTGSLLHYRQQLEKLIPHSVLPPPSLPSPPASAPPSGQPADPKVFTATQQLSMANDAATQQFMQTDKYRQAKEQRDRAHEQVEALGISAPNSDALKQAAQKMIDTDNALSAQLEAALRTDPSVIAARQKLAALRHPTSIP